jgi:hypothetical protein
MTTKPELPDPQTPSTTGHSWYTPNEMRDYAARVCADKDEEIKHLRSALKEISDIEDEMYGPDWEEIQKARNIATAALGEKE